MKGKNDFFRADSSEIHLFWDFIAAGCKMGDCVTL
jgi:hypothetical protein